MDEKEDRPTHGMTPAEFSALVEDLEHVADAMLSIGASTVSMSTTSLCALLSALRETRAALGRLVNDVEPHAHCKWAEGESVTHARAALAAYPLAEPTKGEG